MRRHSLHICFNIQKIFQDILGLVNLTCYTNHMERMSCLPAFYTILISSLTNRIYRNIFHHYTLAKEQTGWKINHKRCKGQLIINCAIIKLTQTHQQNMLNTFVDYEKAFDSIPQSWFVYLH